MMTDAPFQNAKAVLVTFNEVSAHASGGDWKTLPFAGNPAPAMRTCDLKKLEGNKTDILGTGPLDPGHYTQVRLVVFSATIYFDNPTDPLAPACGDAATFAVPASITPPAPLTVVSGDLKLTREFDVPQGGTTTMLVDFKGDQSIFLTGTGDYKMTPVITVVSVQ